MVYILQALRQNKTKKRDILTKTKTFGRELTAPAILLNGQFTIKTSYIKLN